MRGWDEEKNKKKIDPRHDMSVILPTRSGSATRCGDVLISGDLNIKPSVNNGLRRRLMLYDLICKSSNNLA